MPQANSVVVLDFETTGLSPNLGDRAIEIGAVKLVNGEVVDTFQQLMNLVFGSVPLLKATPALPITCCAARPVAMR